MGEANLSPGTSCNEDVAEKGFHMTTHAVTGCLFQWAAGMLVETAFTPRQTCIKWLGQTST